VPKIHATKNWKIFSTKLYNDSLKSCETICLVWGLLLAKMFFSYLGSPNYGSWPNAASKSFSSIPAKTFCKWGRIRKITIIYCLGRMQHRPKQLQCERHPTLRLLNKRSYGPRTKRLGNLCSTQMSVPHLYQTCRKNARENLNYNTICNQCKWKI